MTLQDETRAVRLSSFGWMAQRLVANLDRQMAAELEDLGLTMAKFPLIMMVSELGPVTQADIARRFSRPAYAISRSLDDLVKDGLLERRPHPTSRRAHEIVATPKGQALAPKLHAIVRRVNARVLSPLSPEEQQQITLLMEKLIPNEDRY